MGAAIVLKDRSGRGLILDGGVFPTVSLFPHLDPFLALLRSVSIRDVIQGIRDYLAGKKDKVETQIKERELEQAPLDTAMKQAELEGRLLDNGIKEIDLQERQLKLREIELREQQLLLGETVREIVLKLDFSPEQLEDKNTEDNLQERRWIVIEGNQKPRRWGFISVCFKKFDLWVVPKDETIIQPLELFVRKKRKPNRKRTTLVKQELPQPEVQAAAEEQQKLRALFSALRKLMLIAVFLSQTAVLQHDMARGPALTSVVQGVLVCLLLSFVLGFYKVHRQSRLGGGEWAYS